MDITQQEQQELLDLINQGTYESLHQVYTRLYDYWMMTDEPGQRLKDVTLEYVRDTLESLNRKTDEMIEHLENLE